MENRYYEKELDLNGTAEELYIQARNNYIENHEALKKIYEILIGEAIMSERKGLDATELRTKAEKVKFMELRERDTCSDFSIDQMKIDFMNGGCGGGLDDFSIRDDNSLKLSVFFEPHNSSVQISLNEITEEGYSTGATSLPLDEFKKCSRKDFDNVVNQIYALAMQPAE